MTATTHYDTLEVSEGASAEAIKGAYRYLSQKWHPDKHLHQRDSAERVMQALNDAYAVLSDPAKRREYDAWLFDERAYKKASTSRTDDKPVPDRSQRDEYLKTLSNYSAEPFGAIFLFAAAVVAVVVAALSVEVRQLLFGDSSFRFGTLLLIVTGLTNFVLSARKKRRLAHEETSVLHGMYEVHRRRKNASLCLTWLWLLLAISVYVSYSYTVEHPAYRNALTGAMTPEQRAPLIVRNDCGRSVHLAIHYLAPDARWQTAGMFAFAPGESAPLVRDSNTGELIGSAGDLFYYYAVSTDNEYVWAGDEKNPQHKPVSLGDRTVRFRSAQLKPNEQGVYALALTCRSSGSN